MNISLVNRIRELCREHGISIRKLEIALGFSPKSIVKWDDHTPSIEKVMAVADYFGITVDDLLRTEPPQFTKAEIEDLRYLHDNPDIRILLSASENLSKADIMMLADIARRMNDNGSI